MENVPKVFEVTTVTLNERKDVMHTLFVRTVSVMVLLRKGVLTSGCTHVHTSQFRYSVYLQLYLSIQFSIVFALDRCS